MSESTFTFLTNYESRIADCSGRSYAIAFSYARVALSSILSALELSQDDEVILSPLTCKVVPLALLSLGLKPVYADISAETLNLDPEQVTVALSLDSKAILFQHTYGLSLGVADVGRLARANDIPLIEDCAQSLPISAKGHSPGQWGRAAIFSNNLRKPLPAGSGGVAVTDDGKLAHKIRAYRNELPHRKKWAEMILRAEVAVQKYLLRPALVWPLFELNRKLRSTYSERPLDLELATEIADKAVQVSDYQMREGARWLDRLEEIACHRRRCCTDYFRRLRHVEGLDFPRSDLSRPLYYFPVLVERKEELLRKAMRRNVELVAWPGRTPIYPVTSMSELTAYGYQPGACQVAEDVARHLVGLPTDHMTRERHRDAVVALIREHANSSSHD